MYQYDHNIYEDLKLIEKLYDRKFHDQTNV